MSGSDEGPLEHEVLRVSEVAEYLGVCERVVYDRIHDGVLPAADLGSEFRVLREHLEAVCLGREGRSVAAQRPALFEGLDAALTADEVARLLRVSADTVRRKAGRIIPGCKFGNQWRFHPAAIAELFEVHSVISREITP